ncbi:MAG TPA: hypothetical protein VKD02_00450 [Methyloceanibacter sp.]|nr:hypothetical protein [Methyloceanibacter sp.]
MPSDILKNWDDLNVVDKKLFERQMEVYAAYLAYTDHEIGRVVQAIGRRRQRHAGHGRRPLRRLGVHLLKGKPVFTYDLLDLAWPKVEGGTALTPGKHTVEFALAYDGPGLGKSGTGTITVDGVEAGKGAFPHTIPFALEASETFDVGSDTGTGVNDEDYQTPFAFDGKLNSLTITLMPEG